MGLIINDFETAQGFILPNGYYKLDNITWNLYNNQVNCVFHLYASKEAKQQGKMYFPLETIGYDFIFNNRETDLQEACYNNVIQLIQSYKNIEAAILAYENDENNYTIIYDENTGDEIGRELIPNDELYSQRFVLPSGLEKLLNAVKENE